MRSSAISILAVTAVAAALALADAPPVIKAAPLEIQVRSAETAASFPVYTGSGTAIRAVSEDKATAALMGIDVNRAIVTTFAIGAAMAGAAGVLYGLMFRQIFFFTGFIPGIKAFTAAVLGGIGNIPGAMVGGFLLGELESVGPTLFLDGLGVPSPNQLKDVIAFTILVLVLIFRPQGIMGERLSRSRA